MHTRFLLLCCLFITQSVSALESDALFTIDVTARSQSREDRNAALSEALQLVLNRFVIENDIVHNSALKSALENAASYVDQYQYIAHADDTKNSSSAIMRVTFAKDSLTALLHSSGLAMWGEKRDKTLVWIFIEQKGKQAFLDMEQDTEIAAALQSEARAKGILLLLPLMDLEEKQTISGTDILATRSEKILLASSRYDVASILSGKLHKQRTCWRTEWALYFDNKLEQWTTPCSDLNTNLSRAFARVYEYLSVFYALKS